MPNRINVSDFDLASTLECGQAFRWKREADGWFVGVVGREVWRLRQPSPAVVEAAVAGGRTGSREPPATAVTTPEHYLALDVSLRDITSAFPADDEPLHAAVRQHWGLRVLCQEPWECLASFIASSSKQIVQIRQIVDLLARRFGEPIGNGFHAFPTVGVIARASHQELWDCKLGFRAKNLLAAARMIDDGKIDWPMITRGAVSPPRPGRCDYETALEELMKLPGVGEKIANCVLLFSCGFDQAFPIDVWIERALLRIYFPRRKVTAKRLREFARSHFGSYAGWAQQYLFFNERSSKRGKRSSNRE
jgi:N-glycosylase/DNA lyase